MHSKMGLFIGAFLLVSISADAAETPPPPATVFTQKTQRAEIFDQLSYPAKIVSKINTTLRSEIDGIVGQLVLPLGSNVRQGQAVLVLKHTDPIYEYAPVQIKSPVTGVLSSVLITEGSNVTRGQELATIVDPKKVQAQIEIPAADLQYMRKGLEGQLNFPGAQEPVKVKVRGVSAWVDPATGTASAELEFSHSVPPGVLGEALFKVNVHQGISLPEQAVVYRGKDPFVRLLQEGKVKKVAVTLGRRTRDHIEITKGLDEGVEFIERASRFVADGEAVTVQSTGAGAK